MHVVPMQMLAGQAGAVLGTGDVVAAAGWGNQTNAFSEGDLIILCFGGFQ